MGAGLSMASVNKIKELANSREYSLALELVEHQDLTKSLNPQFLRLCGEIYIKNDRYKDARRCLIMAHRLGPESKRVLYTFVELYLRMGYFQLAKTYYDMYMFDANAYDSRDMEYVWNKHEHADDYKTLEPLIAGYAHNLDYDWSFELYLLYKKEEKQNEAATLAEVEDLYRPYKPKRRTRATIAKEKGLEPLAKDDEFVKKFAAVKKANKVDFAAYAKREYGFELDPNTMFNTMVKRLHEYKRQSLKILSVISTYADIKSGKVKAEDVTPRTVFFGAKAAPGYYLAKMTIQLINNVSRVVNNDPDVKGKLAVYFPWNYNVRLAQHLIPATDLDEQISQAGKEASGTGNMKFALNGAMTVGTLDGANVEIRERVGAENFFLFGMTVDEVEKKYAEGYNPASYYEADPRLKHAIDMVADGTFSNGDRNAYSPLVADWLTKDWFMTLADFSAYMDIQSEIEALYADELEWNRKALLNVANSGYFSSDRSIEDYLERIWHTGPLK